MPKRLPLEVKVHVQKARESALLAVEIYNKPLTVFRSGGYIVLMCIAWTSMFHAIFLQRRITPCYRSKQNPRRYEKRDGDYKAWELSTCLNEYFGVQDTPARKNVEFFIGLRNKIEHRSMPELDVRIFGECQSMLFNLEDMLVQHFGPTYALNESLSLALQFSQMRNPQQSLAMQSLHGPMASRIMNYVDTFRSSLTTEQLNDLSYSYKVFLLPRTANNQGVNDPAVWFVKPESLTEEELDQVSRMFTLVKPMTSQVANQGCYRPKDICAKVLPVVRQYVGPTAKFSASGHHARACEYYDVRPRRGDGDPRKTQTKYCQYDMAHGDYVFTEAWIAHLCEELKKPEQYDAIMGRKR